MYRRYAAMLLLNKTRSPTRFVVEKAARILQQHTIDTCAKFAQAKHAHL
jgi:hypothetical protein